MNGAHGLAGPTTPVPDDVLLAMLREVGLSTGTQLREQSAAVGQRWGQLHPGRTFGTILAWVWDTDPDLAMQLLADVFSGLRHGPGAHLATPPYTLAELLVGLRHALPDRAASSDYEALAARAAVEVPQLYGDPLT